MVHRQSTVEALCKCICEELTKYDRPLCRGTSFTIAYNMNFDLISHSTVHYILSRNILEKNANSVLINQCTENLITFSTEGTS